ncbi:hypothetical protein EKO23_20705 [Nocardioides guangzhouensis]|uniref:Nuclear transport factor 2 family protein n=1 Tax=Nocardioides guangzhouensis TaxID=2497878 RepID=A0A4Q4Z6G3_9ACTN|nr:hypothetical protein [Nocardioides guangzhouensis]RYP82935.1 hypothetical protein EKO23_20705 [Nocardioides guangzhouensis]
MTPEDPTSENATPAHDTGARPTGSPRFRLALAGVLAVALVASVVWLAVAATGRDGGAAANNQSVRETVMVRAKEWMTAFGSYSPEDLDGKQVLTAYRQRVEPLIATGFTCGGVTFEEYASALDRQVAAQKFTMTTSVERTGVESLDDDSAVVVLSGQVAGGRDGKAVEPRDFQMLVDLQRIDGSWQVAKCNDVDSRFSR